MPQYQRPSSDAVPPARQELPGGRQKLPAAPALAPALLALLLAAPGAAAQALGGPPGPPTGEAVLTRDVAVKGAADGGGPAVQDLRRGQTVVVYGTPRGGGWTQIGRDGREIGYVPGDALASPLRPREVAERAAAVAAGPPWLRGERLAGTHVAAAEMKARSGSGKAAKAVTLKPGEPLVLDGFDGARPRWRAPGRDGAVAVGGAALPVVAVLPHGGAAQPGGRFYLAKLGAYPTPLEAADAWAALAGDPGAPHRDSPHAGRQVFVYPLAEGGRLSYSLAFGPFDRAGADGACAAMAARLRDCWLVEVEAR
ncbi:MAG TPA: hypothetical protein VEH84_15530 [Alphaproteobacteria bacterium]|nr:hypothetical protein [Alphaproteobacteria bacterium]